MLPAGGNKARQHAGEMGLRGNACPNEYLGFMSRADGLFPDNFGHDSATQYPTGAAAI